MRSNEIQFTPQSPQGSKNTRRLLSYASTPLTCHLGGVTQRATPARTSEHSSLRRVLTSTHISNPRNYPLSRLFATLVIIKAWKSDCTSRSTAKACELSLPSAARPNESQNRSPHQVKTRDKISASKAVLTAAVIALRLSPFVALQLQSQSSVLWS